MKIAILSGSARPQRQSHKVALAILQYLQQADGIDASLLDVREPALPLLDYVYKSHPSPSVDLKRWQESISSADAYILVSPEHNSSFSGALKNTMDYFYEEYFGKPMCIVAVSAGMLGGVNAAMALQHYCLRLKGLLLPDFMITPKVQSLFNAGGVLTDAAYSERLNKFLDKFLAFSKEARSGNT